jgi:hypothetical protein
MDEVEVPKKLLDLLFDGCMAFNEGCKLEHFFICNFSSLFLEQEYNSAIDLAELYGNVLIKTNSDISSEIIDRAMQVNR